MILKTGSKGDLVKLLQQELGGLKVDGDFGPATEAKVKEYQATKKGTVDGIITNDWLLSICGNPNIKMLALKIAKTQIGECEDPNTPNWGGKVIEYLKSVGLDFPASWCMAFVYWCYNLAAQILNVPNPLYRTGGCILQLQKTAPAHIANTPQVGDIAIMEFEQGHGHTFFVNEVLSDEMKTVEGNSSENGSSNGTTVVAHDRHFGGKIKAYIRVA